MPPAGITVRAHDDEETATSGCASGAVARAGSGDMATNFMASRVSFGGTNPTIRT